MPVRRANRLRQLTRNIATFSSADPLPSSSNWSCAISSSRVANSTISRMTGAGLNEFCQSSRENRHKATSPMASAEKVCRSASGIPRNSPGQRKCKNVTPSVWQQFVKTYNTLREAKRAFCPLAFRNIVFPALKWTWVGEPLKFADLGRVGGGSAEQDREDGTGHFATPKYRTSQTQLWKGLCASHRRALR